MMQVRTQIFTTKQQEIMRTKKMHAAKQSLHSCSGENRSTVAVRLLADNIWHGVVLLTAAGAESDSLVNEATMVLGIDGFTATLLTDTELDVKLTSRDEDCSAYLQQTITSTWETILNFTHYLQLLLPQLPAFIVNG